MPDRRVRRTERLLHQALMSLVLEKKYETITVQEVLDRADVGRSTFYTHFQDKDELLRSGLQNLRNFLNSPQADSRRVPDESYEQIIRFSLLMFEHVDGYRAVIRALLNSSAEIVVRHHIHSVLVSIVGQGVKTEMRRRKVRRPISGELLTHFLVSTYTSILTWWLNSKNPVPPKAIDGVYRILVLPCLGSIFG
jgi:AcrR family transcriptional regulator